MSKVKDKMSRKDKTKNSLHKITKTLSNTDDEESEHELSHYVNDRIKLMKEVLKLIKPKKIKAMAPDCIKDFDVEEINSMLLEELLGISNKRLKYIFNGENVNRESSSSESEEEKKLLDVISLDDISDTDDDLELSISQYEKDTVESELSNVKQEKDKRHKQKIKTEHNCNDIPSIKSEKSSESKRKKSKIHKTKSAVDNNDGEGEKEKLMSVLELLELQARARAIRSQLALENTKKKERSKTSGIKIEDNSDSDAVIVESPKYEEILIETSGSEHFTDTENNKTHDERSKVGSNSTKGSKSRHKRHKQAKTHEVPSTQQETSLLENEGVTFHDQTSSFTKNKHKKQKTQKVKIIRDKLISVENKSQNSNISEISNVQNTVTQENDGANSLTETLTLKTIEITQEKSVDVSLQNDDTSNQKDDKESRCKSSSPKNLSEAQSGSKTIDKQFNNQSDGDNDAIIIDFDDDEMNSMEN